jgi:hypothetical protein
MVGLLLGELVGGEFAGWPEPDSFGRNRNPAGIWRNPEVFLWGGKTRCALIATPNVDNANRRQNKGKS